MFHPNSRLAISSVNAFFGVAWRFARSSTCALANETLAGAETTCLAGCAAAIDFFPGETRAAFGAPAPLRLLREASDTAELMLVTTSAARSSAKTTRACKFCGGLLRRSVG